jgi:hypothetical protein
VGIFFDAKVFIFNPLTKFRYQYSGGNPFSPSFNITIIEGKAKKDFFSMSDAEPIMKTIQ